MNKQVDHVIEVRTVGENGELLRKDPHDPTGFDSPVAPKANKKAKDSVTKLMALQMGKQALGYGLSNYGNLTGDYIGQARLNDALNAAGMIGTALTGPVGLAVVAGQVAIAGFNRYADVQKSKVISQNMQARVGISIGGSR